MRVRFRDLRDPRRALIAVEHVYGETARYHRIPGPIARCAAPYRCLAAYPTQAFPTKLGHAEHSICTNVSDPCEHRKPGWKPAGPLLVKREGFPSVRMDAAVRSWVRRCVEDAASRTSPAGVAARVLVCPPGREDDVRAEIEDATDPVNRQAWLDAAFFRLAEHVSKSTARQHPEREYARTVWRACNPRLAAEVAKAACASCARTDCDTTPDRCGSRAFYRLTDKAMRKETR